MGKQNVKYTKYKNKIKIEIEQNDQMGTNILITIFKNTKITF